MSETSEMLERRWRKACVAVFREEAGGLEECAPWLSEDIEPITHNKSSLSGKDVVCAPTEYAKGSKWLSFDEVDFNRRFEPLNINEIKDIDSLVGALAERFYYSGNIFFGNSGHIERSSNVNDSFYIYETARYGNSKYIAYCTFGRQNEDCFGCNMKGECSYCIKCHRCYRCKRCFELWMGQNSADCYYSYGLEGCSDCIFSFNVRSRRHAVGNLALAPDKYGAVKNKLLAEMAEMLRRGKRLPSLVEIVKKSAKAKPAFRLSQEPPPAWQTDKDKIEEAFSKTTSVLFGRKLEGGIDSYSAWLKRHTRSSEKCFSAASGKELYLCQYANYTKLPRDRLLGIEEAWAFGSSASLDEAGAESLSLENAHTKIGKLAYFATELWEGVNSNIIECPISFDSSNCYRSIATVYSKYCGYSFWPRSCEHLFGCDSPFDSAFSINCYSCTQLTRCFEIDCCGYCSDSYFCHNGENLHNCMFCFNAKNRNYSVGNAQLAQGDYAKVKSALLSQIAGELGKKKDLKWDIYNIGAARKS
jgi:hypothetical protein